MAHEAYIREVAGAKKAVLFIHGFLGSPEHYTKFIGMTPENIAVHNILLVGHGGETLDFSKASMNMWKEQVDTEVRELIGKYNDVYIVAHSMGTFFAMDAAVKYPDNIKGLFLLASPLKIGLRFSACVNSFKSIFGLHRDDDAIGKAYNDSHSVKLTKKFWQYIGWIPRYLELFSESARGRETVKKVCVPCTFYQSKNDELVSIRTLGYITQKDNIRVEILEKSAHFIYHRDDFEYLSGEFSAFIG